MKKMLAIILVVVLALPLMMFSFASAAEELPYRGEVLLNGTALKFDLAPDKLNGYVYVPLMEIAEKVGVEVSEDQFTTAKEVQEVVYVTINEFAKVAGLYYYENKLVDRNYLMNNEVASADGVYTVWSTPDSRGDAARIILTIKDGKIVEANFDEQRKTGEWKFADGKYTANWASRFEGLDPDALLAQMLEELVAKQEPSKVDVATGATSSYKKLTELASKAIAKAKIANIQKDVPAYRDGKYEVIGLEDERGYAPILKMVVKNGKISSVRFDEFKNGVGKRGTDYVTRWGTSREVDPEAIIANAEAQLLRNQDASLVDVLTGATGWNDNFGKMVAGALDQAARSDVKVEANYQDGLYWVRGAQDGDYTPILKLIVKEGQIADVEFHEINMKDMTSKKYNGYAARWGEKRGIDPLAVLAEMEANVVETQNFNIDTDVITGATGWATKINELGIAALVDASQESIYVFVGNEEGSAYVRQFLAMERKGELLAVDYFEYQRTNYIPKMKNPGYVGPESRWVTTKQDQLLGRAPLAILDQILETFMETKSVEGLDTITGATNWLKGINLLAPKALELIK